MFCPKCGKEIDENQKFCSECGTALKTNESQPKAESATTENKTIKTSNNNYLWKPIAAIFVVFIILTIGIAVNNRTDYDNSSDSESITSTTEDDTQNSQEDGEEYYSYDEKTAPRNCVYETRSGSCFTTKIFKTPVLSNQDCMNNKSLYGIQFCNDYKDGWAAATKACQDLGYKLPEEHDLTSLASDILGGIEINRNLNSSTYEQNEVGLNPHPLNALGTQYYKDYYSFYLWENDEFNADKAYRRSLGGGFMGHNTSRYLGDRSTYGEEYVVCVYDPYGKPKKDLFKPAQKPKPVVTKTEQNTINEETKQQQNDQLQRSSEEDLF